MQNLAVAYRKGEGELAVDLAEAAKWFARASKGEYDEAFYLAWMSKDRPKPKPPSKLKKKIAAATRSAIRITATPRPDARLAIGDSKIGGEPDLPPGAAWPEGMTFLAQINLADAAPHDKDELLPKKGRLWFFHDTRGHGAGVVLNATAGAKLTRTKSPLRAKGKYDVIALAPAAIDFVAESTIPHHVSSEVAKWKLSDEEHAQYADARPQGQHRMLGHADLVQEDTPEGVLLFQLTSDEKIGSNWDGTVYFVIATKDLAAGRFAKTTVTFQS
jgi:uncharacterized protein YwqG